MVISMPIMDGKQAIKMIRENEAADDIAHTPIVALTAHAMAGDDSEILQAGLDHYLTKPLRKLDIFAQILAAMPEQTEPVFDDPDPAPKIDTL